MHCIRVLLLLLFLWDFLVSQSSNAFPFDSFRRLSENSDVHFKRLPLSRSSSPAPSPSQTSDVNCQKMAAHCRVQNFMAACLLPGWTGMILVKNDAGVSIRVNVTILPAKKKYEIKMLKNQVTKINVAADLRKSSSIILTAEDKKCLISMGTTIPPSFFYNNGGFVLFATALIIGVAITCYRSVKIQSRTNGIPYQELEMNNSGSQSSSNVETAEGWDQGWDDNWDSEKALSSPGGKSMGARQLNGLSSRSSNTR